MKHRQNTPTQHLRNQPLWLTSLLALLLMLATVPGEAAVHATLNRDTVYAGGTLTLTIESDGQHSDQQPDLTPLGKNFDILGTSTRTQVSIINGRRSDKTLWQVQIQPRHTGQLRIPSIRVGGQQTKPLELKIIGTSQQTVNQANQHVFVKAEVKHTGKQTYVQQQIPYTVRLYYDGRMQEGELRAPKLQNAVVEQLGEDKSYSTVRNGKTYSVIERHYMISPEKSGSLHIPPATFSGRITVPQPRIQSSRPRSLMEEFLGNDPFASDPFSRNSLLNDNFFNGTPFGNHGKAITARSQSVNMVIKARPASAGRNWLPAEAVTLGDSWTKNPPRFRAGEPVSRTITIQARGLSGSQIPELAIASPANARLYPETPHQESRTDGQILYGIRTQTLTYIPGAQGTLDVPAVTIKWWDTRRNITASTTLPARQFKVLPGAAGTASAAQTNDHRPVAHQSAQTSTANKAVQTNAERVIPEALTRAIKANWIWLIASIGLLLTLLAVIKARRTKQRRQVDARNTAKQTPQSTQHPARPNQKSVLRALQKACMANDRQAAARALLDLGHAQWPDNPPRSLSALATRTETGQTLIRALDRSLYANDDTVWNGAAMWDRFSHGLQEKTEVKHKHDNDLAPLYPQHS
ncbi:MAG TPA: protein BatD [Gammaproteobacteria bacterium]|nr:protein BatD [Gammaproteobacteria bacterium]